MRRRPFRKQTVGVSLFPFLAVLICTMGGLIVLLVVTVQQARVHASTVQSQREEEIARGKEDEKELLKAREDEEWKQELLLASRAELVEDLAKQRLELGHLEDHIRRLQERLEQLNAQAAELKRLADGRTGDAALADEELAAVRAAIALTRQELAAAQKRVDSQRRSYAIVPIPRTNGTLRRPIYIECTADAVTLQPEGIVLTAADFRPPLGPGNALSVALRSVREYLATHGGVDRHGYPYPLILVRPDGAGAYAAVRQAIKEWDDEFGYELVDAELVLAYGEANDEMAEVVQESVELARRRRAALAALAPSRYGGEGGEGGDAGMSGSGDVQQNGERRAGEQPDGLAGGRDPGGEGTKRKKDGPAAPPGVKPAEQEQQGGQPGGLAMPGAPQGEPMQNLAESKGSGWGLKKGRGQVTGFTRPIRVSCQADRLIILPERRSDQRLRVVTYSDSMPDDVVNFVEEIHLHVEAWGIAGPTAYWKPILEVDVTPGAERRFEQLRFLLEGSGIEVERSKK